MKTLALVLSLVVATAQAGSPYQLGQQDGQQDGAKEGNERGYQDGREHGKRDGFDQGFRECEKQQARQAYERGFEQGYKGGFDQGGREGYQQGRLEGENTGRSDGERDGLERSDRDASASARPKGRAKGVQEAESSDAASRGQAEGTTRGDQEALAQAQRVDYPRGRKTYREERFAEKIDSKDHFSNQSSVRTLMEEDSETGDEGQKFQVAPGIQPNRLAGEPRPSPDRRYHQPKRNFPTPGENQQYAQGYDQGYQQGYAQAYDGVYGHQYRRKHKEYYNKGCARAYLGDYRQIEENGRQEGFQKGYQEGYQPAYTAAYREAYNEFFGPATQAAYDRNYPVAYERHFESARSQAYAEQYRAIYDSAFSSARSSKYSEMLPVYSEREYTRGRTDEQEDFRLRPVRLLFAEVTETIANGLFEPGEKLHLRLKLRNFSADAVSAQDVKLQVASLTDGVAVISQGQSLLAQGLNPRSETEITEALEFQFKENAVQRSIQLQVTVLYQGRNVGTEVIRVVPQFMVHLSFPEPPQFQEGIETAIRVRVQNKGNVSTEENLKVAFDVDSAEVDVKKGLAEIGILQPGETRDIEFVVVAHSTSSHLRVPLAIQARMGADRRVGLLDETHQVPIVNDYRLTLRYGADKLQEAGLVRIGYTIRNANSRLTHRGLEVYVKFAGEDADQFVVIGPNPQWLKPVLKGRSTQFVVPVLVKEAHLRGALQIEVHEDGRRVVVHNHVFGEPDLKTNKLK